jgi:hypothetical protein
VAAGITLSGNPVIEPDMETLIRAARSQKIEIVLDINTAWSDGRESDFRHSQEIAL